MIGQLLPVRPKTTNSYRVSTPTRSNAKAWARTFEARLLEPGIVSYEDQGCGKAFLTREDIDRSAHTFIGRPLILTARLKHKKVTPADLEREARGYMTETFWGSDGWLWCRGICHDDDAKNAINNVGFCSCAYEVLRVGQGGEYHAIKYDEQILEFSGEHLAIVDRPRYEGATIRLNSKPKNDTHMSMFKWIKKIASRQNATEATVAEKAAADAAAATAAAAAAKTSKENAVEAQDIDGDTELEIPTRENGKTEKVKLATLVEVYNAREDGVSPESEIEVAGKPVKISALVEAYNAKDDDDAEEAKKKKAREKAEADEKDAKEKKDRENAKPSQFRVLLNARAQGSIMEGPISGPDDIISRVNRGAQRYGSAVTPAGKN